MGLKVKVRVRIITRECTSEGFSGKSGAGRGWEGHLGGLKRPLRADMISRKVRTL